jgi:hypothetical protein
MPSVVENYHLLNRHILEDTHFFDPGPVKSPGIGADYYGELEIQIRSGENQLSDIYQRGYSRPLLARLDDVTKALVQFNADPTAEDSTYDPKRWVYLTLLLNAAIQPGQQDVAPHLRPLQAVASDIYNRFLEARDNLKIKSPLDHPYPPLVGFIGPLPPQISKKPPLPCMLERDQMRELLGDQIGDSFAVGVVGVPPGYRNHPLLWGVLGHEIGGHYVLHGVDKLLKEIEDKVYRLVRQKYRNLPMEKTAPLWRYWAEEAAADVCAVLTLGPSCGIGAISFYTAILPLSKWQDASLLKGEHKSGNRHPCPELVPHLISGAVEQLTGLSSSRRTRYVAQLKEISEAYSDTNEEVKFLSKGEPIKLLAQLPGRLPLKQMQESARYVGSCIACMPLNSLGNGKHTLQDLRTWRDRDEDIALVVADRLQNGARRHMIEARDIDPLHLLAGGILAAIRHPMQYDEFNEALSETFKVKYSLGQ